MNKGSRHKARRAAGMPDPGAAGAMNTPQPEPGNPESDNIDPATGLPID